MCIGLKYILKGQLVKDFGGEWAASTLFQKLLKKAFRIYSGIFARIWKQKHRAEVAKIAGKASCLNWSH